jgi:hexosaminidase
MSFMQIQNSKFKIQKIATLLFVLSFATNVFAQHDANMGIIPAPVSVKKGKGEFKISPETILLVDSPKSRAVIYLAEYMRKAGYGGGIVDLNTLNKDLRPTKNVISLMTGFKGDMPSEGYALDITEDHIKIKGKGAGLFWGIQTLLQLLEPKNAGYAVVPCASVKDNPRFEYRGMHLDVARHFFDVDFVKQYLDLMAAYKLNTFHWHLTDDQGWRIEIKKYPKLTEIGSKRAQTKIGRAGVDTGAYDGTPYGGFYTQDQIREIVQYAHARYISIVPEIDIPGHSLAAIAAYPELSCDPSKTYKVRETWGTSSDDVISPTDENFRMLDEILLEVMELFPDKYMHIGGDEVSMEAWKASDFCRQLIADKNLKDVNGLHAYFIEKIEKFVNAQGHNMIGWDEIVDAGLSPNVTVMSWRGEAGGIKAAQLNHDVIMTPGSGGMYFDHAQSKSTQEPLSIGGNAPLEKTYAYDPVPAALSKEQQKHIIGVQANLWTEYIATPVKVEYMLLPRMLALAEVGWTPTSGKDYNNFSRERVAHHLAKLDAQGINYRVPVPIGANDTTMTGSKFTIELAPSVEGAKVCYTIDGTTPHETDMVYTTPLKFELTAGKRIELQTIVVTPSGKRSISTSMKMVGQ